MQKPVRSEEDLLKACLKKDALAQREFYERYARKMFGVCLRYVKDNDEAQDILQDGFVKVFQKLETFKTEGSLEGWIRRIMVNTALDHLRKTRELRFAVNVDDVEHQLEQHDFVVENMSAEVMLRILNTIPAGYRAVFNMFAIEGYSHKEIADELGISVNTSKSQYSRAREFIQKVLEKQKVI
jgi:RNA polymerase sigma-70 factor (ECF subfamily)